MKYISKGTNSLLSNDVHLTNIYGDLTDEQIYQAIKQGNEKAKNEFFNRVKAAEIEGDYIMANYLYKSLVNVVC